MRYRVRAIIFGISASVAAAAGCQTPEQHGRPHPTPLPMVIAPATSASAKVIPAAAVVPADEGAGGVPAAVLLTAGTAPAGPLTIADLEQLALAHNPTLVQAAAYIEAARGKALQAGLLFNPTIGMEAEQIGADRTAGEVRWFTLQQQVVTGGKLRLSRLKYQQEADLAEIQAYAQRLRVVNGLARAYFAVLAAQRSVENHRRLRENAKEAEETSRQLVNVGQGNQQDLLQAEVEAAQARVAFHNSEARLRQDWVELAALVGVPDLPQRPLSGQLEPDGPALKWDESLARLLQESPELAFAIAKVKQDQTTVQRERREPIPNITVRGGVGYNFETRNNTADVSFSLPLPTFDRNQGTVRQALADQARSQAEVTRVQLDLQRRLAAAFARYETALAEVENFRDVVMPKAKKATELYEQQLKARRAAFPQVLVSRRTVYQLSEENNQALEKFRAAEIEVRGLLLVDGLSAARDPSAPGHINATPKPR